MNDYPLISIIIANWNGGDVFKSCLLSLKKISYPRWELIIVDNGSVDKSETLPAQILSKKIKKILIKNKKNLGFANACNQGYEKASGKYILLLNNDTVVTKNFLNVLVEKLENNHKIGVIQPKIYLLDKKGYLDNTGSYLTRIGFLHHEGFLKRDTGRFNKQTEPLSIKGACMLIRSAVIKRIGLFDKDFFSYFEESDFCWRVWLSGFSVVYYPKTYIFHKVGFTIKRLDVININYHYYKNRICSLIKNLELKNVVLVIPAHLLISLILATAFLLKGSFRNSLMIIEAMIWNLQKLSKTLEKRKRVQKERVLGDDFIFKNLAVSIGWGEFYKDFKRVEKDISK